MAEVWSPDVSQELQRQYDLTVAVQATGAVGLSPVFNVGPGADAAISRTQSFGLHVNVAAGAAVTGAAGIVVPSTDSRVVVIRGVNMDCGTANQFLLFPVIPLGSLIETTFAPTLALMPTNLRNFITALGPVMGFVSTTTSPAASGVIDSVRMAAATSLPWHRRYVVLVPNTAFLVLVNGNNTNYNVDFEVDVFQPQSK